MHDPHAAIYRHDPKAKTAIVAIHGFMGSPAIFEPLIKYVQDEGMGLYAPLLPGHGVSARSFAETRGDLWETHANETIRTVPSNYGNIVLVGHSLGALLCILNTIQAPRRISGIVTMSAAFFPRATYRMMKNALTSISGKDLQPDHPAYAARHLNGISRGTFLDDIAAAPRYKELMGYARRTREALPSLKVPIKAFFGLKDEAVSIKGASFLESTYKNSETEMLKTATHLNFSLSDWESIIAAVDSLAKEQN